MVYIKYAAATAVQPAATMLSLERPAIGGSMEEGEAGGLAQANTHIPNLN
jgi:hypothetical protein